MDYEIKKLYDRNKKLTMFLLKYKGYEIAIHVFHTRGSFLWIGSLARPYSKIKWFNDVPRAMQMFKLITMQDSRNNLIKVTENIDKFLFDYQHSKFIECNSELASNYTSSGKYEQKEDLNKRITPCMIELADTLESMYKRYWLSSGTLLGWYRQCGIIAHTTDIDFSMSIKEYEDRLNHHFRFKSRNIFLWLQLGRKKNSLEFRLGGCEFSYDIFFLYELSPTRYCNYYHVHHVIP